MSQLLETSPQVKVLPPPSQEVSSTEIANAKAIGLVTPLGAETLEKVRPELAQAVLKNTEQLGKPPYN